MKTIICPVCGKGKLTYDGDVCPVCNWFHDIYQEKRPDEDCGENHMSLNEAKKAWAEGRPIE